jgi:regulator of replication initiation timing
MFKFKKTDPIVEEIKNVLKEGLEEMRKLGVDRVILTIYETEQSETATGRFLTGGDYNYYPIETLTPDEREFIKEGKTYEVIALVLNDGVCVKYPKDGIEIYKRTRIKPFLPRLKEQSSLNYVTEGGVVDDLSEFANYAKESGWEPDHIRKRIKAGIEEFKYVTHELILNNSELQKRLEEIEKRQKTPSEEMMDEMRENIYNTKQTGWYKSKNSEDKEFREFEMRRREYKNLCRTY